ncbi:biotin transporter BioY [Coriobacteriia bacterium Es71-Z0120]|uniref:biotin transporter BioY n=1 Tax=Parvivirga hydrogeniphila TaxID=2939460 RepID=UPI0022608493|nr:biotin transporter BioY [Parvivirga hydrogeniphila]MCL4079375.1 biotin transporter BioY [Parvivirga hydrogeniphila]
MASRVRSLARIALLAALIAAGAWISLPIGQVPFTLQVLVVVLVALVLPPYEAGMAVAVYLLAGAVGAPVFSGGRAGLQVFAGPSGGYLVGFLLGAVAGAWLRQALRGRASEVAADVVASVAVIAAVYLVGWAHIAFVVAAGPVAAFAAGVLPFVALDAAKAAGAIAVARVLRAAGIVSR